jgi:quercetin dioxygenase-like cupin family protein
LVPTVDRVAGERILGRVYPSQPHPAGVVETISVTHGQMVLIADGTEHTLTVGAAATFDAGVDHTYQRAGADPCDLIMTVHLPAAPVSGN